MLMPRYVGRVDRSLNRQGDIVSYYGGAVRRSGPLCMLASGPMKGNLQFSTPNRGILGVWSHRSATMLIASYLISVRDRWG
mgnify:CR=1 FL=1